MLSISNWKGERGQGFHFGVCEVLKYLVKICMQVWNIRLNAHPWNSRRQSRLEKQSHRCLNKIVQALIVDETTKYMDLDM